MNLKAQIAFVHIIVNVIFKYMLQVKDTKHLFDNKVGRLNHIKACYGCYHETTKNGILHIHTLLRCGQDSV
jgi:hypothetical protein